MSRLRDKFKNELEELIPVTVFFLVAFQLLAVTQALMLEEYGIRATNFVAAAIAALVVAKVVVITDHVPFVNRFPDRPLVYNVVWKTAIYLAASLAVRYAEHVIHYWRQTGNFPAANRLLFDKIVWPHFWGLQLWLLILLFVYCTLREVVRALGRERVVRMFFISAVHDTPGEPRGGPPLVGRNERTSRPARSGPQSDGAVAAAAAAGRAPSGAA